MKKINYRKLILALADVFIIVVSGIVLDFCYVAYISGTFGSKQRTVIYNNSKLSTVYAYYVRCRCV